MSTKGTVIKIPLVDKDNGVFEREKWYGMGPFKAVVSETGDLSIKLPDTESQIAPSQQNDFGKYWIIKFLGDSALVSIYEHSEYGTAVRVKLGKNAVLPDEVKAKIAGPQSGSKPKKVDKPKKTVNAWS